VIIGYFITSSDRWKKDRGFPMSGEENEKTESPWGARYGGYPPGEQLLSNFEDEMEKYWGRKWKANTSVGRLRVVMLHRPGKEFLSVGKPTPWPPHDSSLEAWGMTEKPDLEEMLRDHENMVDAYEGEGVEVVIRKPDPFDPPYLVWSLDTDDSSYAAIYGRVVLRMLSASRRGEEVPTYRTLAEVGCPVVGMIVGYGMAEGGTIGWLDEKHLIIQIHGIYANTRQPVVWRANESGFRQFARIVKLQDPEVDVRMAPGYGYRLGGSPLNLTYQMVDRHTSICDPRWLSPWLADWMTAEMDWEFIVPPKEVWRDYGDKPVGPETGVALGPMKVLVPAPPASEPKGNKWLESIGVEVVQVECSSIVVPRRNGFMHCTAASLIRDPEPKSY
jgi:N-dimethylarginine dimethylaminohydrolase